MRLLYICSDFGIPPDGTKGPSIHLRSITRALCAAGHELRLLSPKAGPGDNHPMGRLLEPGCRPADKDAKMLKRWMGERGYGETLGQELRPLLYNAWVHPRAMDALEPQPVDVIIERLSLFGHVGLDLAEACDVPLVLEVNALMTDESRRFRSLQLAELAETIETRVLQSAAAINAVSQPLAQQLRTRGIAADKIHVVPNGVDVELFDAAPPPGDCRAKLGLHEKFVVGFVGSLKVWHGVDILLEAFKRLHAAHKDTRLLIVGTGPMEEALRQRTQRDGLENAVTFTGPVAHERVPEIIRAMDVAVAPFTAFDGFYFSPIKLFEYMAGGAAVVASRLGQIQEVIDDGQSGLLCKPGDAADLCAQLEALRAAPQMRIKLTARARQSVRAHHTWDHAAQKTLRVISDALRPSRATTTRAAS